MRVLMFLTLSLALAFLCGCPTHNLLRETPLKWDVNLAEREAAHWTELQTHLLPEGLVVYMKRPPYDTAALYRQGTVQADGAYFSGYVLATLCFKWKVTGDPALLEQAKKVWDAHHFLVTGSGYPGLVARSFGKNDPNDEAYVFRKDGSGDGLIGWMFGTTAFVRLVDDPVRRQQAAADVKAICEHLRKHDLKIYEHDGKPTPYGNFKTPVVGVPIAHYALPMCGLAALAVYLNPNDEACAEFQRWINEQHYPRQTQYFYPWFPQAADNSCAFALNLVTAWWNDENEHRRGFYRQGADAFWARCYDWQMALFALCYKFTGGDDHSSHIRDGIDRLRNVSPYYRQLVDEKRKEHAAIVPIEDRPFSSAIWTRDVWDELLSQEGERVDVYRSRQDFLLAYWFGRYLGEYGEAGDGAE